MSSSSLISLLILSIVFGPSYVLAKVTESKKLKPIFLTAKELDHLSNNDQIEYYKNVKIVLFNFEKNVGTHFSQNIKEHSLYALNSLLTFLIGEARALSPPAVRCVYAGFVILGSKCVPKSSFTFALPVDIEDSDGNLGQKIIEITFKCTQGKVLCNPLVYGYNDKHSQETADSRLGPGFTTSEYLEKAKENAQKSYQPYCVDSPTDKRNTNRECFYVSQDDKLSVKPIRKYNEDKWNEFTQNFEWMCNPDQISKNPYLKDRPRAQQDVLDSCAWSRWKMDRDGGKTVEPILPEYRMQFGPRTPKNIDMKPNEPIRAVQ